MAAGSIAQVTGSAQNLPGTSWALNDFGSITTDLDSILSEASGVFTPQDAGFYLILAEAKFTATHSNRIVIEQKIQKNSADFAGAIGSDYARNANNDMLWVRSSMIAHFNGTTDDFEIHDRRDSGDGTPAGSYTWTRIKIVQLSAGDTDSLAYGHYGTPTSAAHATSGGPDASSVVDGFDVITENDTTSIELQAGGTDITLKKTDRPYLVLYGFPTDANGSGRTFRLSDLTFGGTRINHSFGHAYQRNANNQYAAPEGMALIAPSVADDLNARIWLWEDNKAVHWGTANGEGWTLSAAAGRSGIIVVELPASTDFAIFDDATANQTFSGNATLDINVAATETIAGTNFTRDSATAVTVGTAANVLAYAAYLIERTASSGTRLSNAIRWEVEGVDKTTETEFGQYERGEQSADDEKNTAMGATHVDAISAGDTFNLEKFDPGTDDGNNDVTSHGGSFFIDLDSLASGGTPATVSPATIAAVAAVLTPIARGQVMVAPVAIAAVTSMPDPIPQGQAATQPSPIAALTQVPTPTPEGQAAASPATIAALTTVEAPQVAAAASVAPVTIGTATTIPQPATTVSPTVNPVAIAATATVPTPSPAGQAAATPAAIAATTTVPTPAALASALVTPGVIEALTTVPTPTIVISPTVNPSVIAAITTVPTPTFLADATVTPAVITALTQVPVPTARGQAAVTPITIAALTTVPTPALSTGSTVSPVTIAALGAVPTPALIAGAVVTPATVAALTAVPTPTITLDTTVTPATIAALTQAPTPTILAGAVVTPEAIAAITQVPSPVAAGQGAANPTTIAAHSAVPGVTLLAGATVTPGTVAVVTAVPSPAILIDAVVNPAVIAAIMNVPTPAIEIVTIVTPATIAAIAQVPTPTIVTPATVVTPATIAALTAVKTPGAAGQAIVTPAAIAAIAAVPTPDTEAAVTVSPAAIAAIMTVLTPLAYGANELLLARIIAADEGDFLIDRDLAVTITEQPHDPIDGPGPTGTVPSQANTATPI